MSEDPMNTETVNDPAGPGRTTTDGETGAANLQRELAEARGQRDEYLEQLQRSRAEFANFQKRVKTQADSDRVYAVGNLAKDLLDGLDNLRRAAEALRASDAVGIADGLDMVHKQLLATLGKYGVEPIQALGRPFDPNLHEAVMRQPADDKPEMTVVSELSKGYKIHDRVLRPTQVAVSVRPAQS